MQIPGDEMPDVPQTGLLPNPEDIFDIHPLPPSLIPGGILLQDVKCVCMDGRVPFDALVNVHIDGRLCFLQNELKLITAGSEVGGLYCPVLMQYEDEKVCQVACMLFAQFQETADGKFGLWPCQQLKVLEKGSVDALALNVHEMLGGKFLEKIKDLRFVFSQPNALGSRFDCLEEPCFWLRVNANLRNRLAREAADKAGEPGV